MKQRRHSLLHRLVRAWLVERSLLEMVALYFVVGVGVVAGEVAITRFAPCLWPGWHEDALGSFIKDVTSYFIAAQVGILAVVSVAVAVVTLLSQNDNSSAVKTDVRLYYVSSYAYELVTSSVALLVVLSIQLFWPLEFIVHGLGWVGVSGNPPKPDLLAKAVMTGVHTIWQAANALLFLHFTTTTLRFVEPSAREAMREAYSANQVIPRDLADRLGRTFVAMAATNLFTKEQLDGGPLISFGRSVILDENPVDEVVLNFKTPHYLKDIRFRLAWLALWSWRGRVRRKTPRRKPGALAGSRRQGELALPISINEDVNGRVALVQREAGVPLLPWEKIILRMSYSFAKRPRGPDPLTPADFLEALTDKVISQIEKDAVMTFQAAFREVTSYHNFILAAQNTRDEEGRALNLAEIGGLWARPDEEWVRQYRRVYDAAAKRLSDTTEFMDWLCYLPSRLLPEDRNSISPRVVKSIVDLGVFWVLSLEGWVTRRTLPTWRPSDPSSARLAGTDQSAFERTLIEFTGAWESLEDALRSLYRLERRAAQPEGARWRALCSSWPSVDAHLEATAYFLAYSVWNEDRSGSQRFRDILLRWPTKFYSELQNLHDFVQAFLLTSDVLALEWAAAEAASTRRQRFPDFDRLSPESLFGAVVLGMCEDVTTVCAALALLWHAEGQLETPIGADAANGLLRREMMDEGSDLIRHIPRRAPFRLAFDLLVRRGLNPLFGDRGYGENVDQLVRKLSNIASRRMVPGRGYSGWGLEGVDTIKRPLLAIIAAFMPNQADGNVIRDVAAMLEPDGPLAEGRALRDFKFYIEQLISTLGTEVDASFTRCVQALVTDLNPEEARSALHDLLTAVHGVLKQAENERRQNAPLDEEVLASVRRQIEERIFEQGPTFTFFGDAPRRRGGPRQPIQQPTFGQIDKGAFLRPPYSAQTAEELGGIIGDVGLEYLGALVVNGLFALPRIVVETPPNGDRAAFWREVVARKAEVGPQPTVIAPFDVACEVSERHQVVGGAQHLDGFAIDHHPDMPSGHGYGYMGTLEGVHVYAAQGDDNHALLFSGQALRSIEYGAVRDDGSVADFEFFGDDVERSHVRFTFAQTTHWSEGPVFDFRPPQSPALDISDA